MPTKSPLQSKTLWINLIVAIAAFIPQVSEYIASHPEVLTIAFAVVNVVLRLLTKDKIQLTDGNQLPA